MATATERKSGGAVSPTFLTGAQRKTLRRRLLTWYASNRRDLLWRRSRDPYRVWISEIMLQQTQVATVGEYFTRFAHRFPDVQSLAAAHEADVLRMWEGLGYYRRARQLHAAAKKIVQEHGGQFPANPAALQTLPGIGRYTAGAIASIAFGRRAAILEANTIRLLSRLIAFRGNPHTQTGQRPLWQLAKEILPQKNVAEFNQALMELGSLVCKPSEPDCVECPLMGLCAANADGLQNEIPPAKPRKMYTERHEAAVIVRKNGSVLVRQCAADERWAGLWDFPRFALDADGPLVARDEIVAKVASQTGVTCVPGALLKTIKHGVTRYRITLDCYQAKFVRGKIQERSSSPLRWLAIAELSTLPLNSTGRQIANLLTA